MYHEVLDWNILSRLFLYVIRSRKYLINDIFICQYIHSAGSKIRFIVIPRFKQKFTHVSNTHVNFSITWRIIKKKKVY